MDYVVVVQVLVDANSRDEAQQEIYDVLDAHWSVLGIDTEAAE